MKQLTEHVYYMDADPNTDQPFVFYVKGKKLSLMEFQDWLDAQDEILNSFLD